MSNPIETTLSLPESRSGLDIRDPSADFLTLFYAVADLRRLAEEQPDRITADIIRTIGGLLTDGQYSDERRGLFLYREASETLAMCLQRCPDDGFTRLALDHLLLSLKSTSGFAHRATAEAMGRLPVKTKPPGSIPKFDCRPLKLSWRRVRQHFSIRPWDMPRAFGRSLVVPLPEARLLVLKFARKGESPSRLLREIHWMHLLRGIETERKDQFDVPEPIVMDGHSLFRMIEVPIRLDGDVHPGRYAVGFLSSPDYFCYPNTLRLSEAGLFQEIISRNARLLADLTGAGIVHTAPIPLFHNRVQTHRRRDEGIYEWFRGGRLDRWLASCAYPNLGASGIRDFEHFVHYKGGPLGLYRYIGSHILSLLLVAGSFFRHQDGDRVGLDDHGNPVDARDLFDRDLLKLTIKHIITGYYEGFVGRPMTLELPLDMDSLADRMIDEMGVDRHMEEILRVADQMHMSDADFDTFLEVRGFTRDHRRELVRGEQDITLLTGPHLGNFNDTISLPELTLATETISALCMAGRCWTENREGEVMKKTSYL